jgi:hypothetical protein
MTSAHATSDPPSLAHEADEHAFDAPRSGSTFGHRFPTDAELVAGVAHELGFTAEDLRDGRHMRRVNHVVQMIQVYHRQARARGKLSGHKKRAAVAAALWADVHCQADMKRKWKQLRTWEEIAERAGFLRVVDGRGARALAWELLGDWQRYAGVSRGYSSVGYSPSDRSCEVRRRRETSSERRARRVRPNCRRVGNKTGAVGRLEAESPSSKPSEKSQPSGLGSSPKGTPPTKALDVRGHEAATTPVDAPAPSSDPAADAAPDWAKQRLEWLDAAERLFAEAFGAPVGGRLADGVPLLKAMERFERSAADVAELNGWQPATAPRALSMLQALIGGELDALRWGERRPRQPPRHLGYFVAPLLAEARRNEERRRKRKPGRRREKAAPPRPRPELLERRPGSAPDQRRPAKPEVPERVMALLAQLRREHEAEQAKERQATDAPGSHPQPRRGSGAPRSEP